MPFPRSPEWPRVVLFDCAQTLLDVRWDERDLIRRAADRVGLAITEAAIERYGQLHRDRRSDYVAAHLALNQQPDSVDKFWDSLLHDWRGKIGIGAEWQAPITQACEALIFSRNSPFFQPYPDVVPTLDHLRSLGIRLGVVSNWDSSLDRLLQIHGLRDYFEVVAASLVIGVEKPDPKIFEWTLSALNVSAAECLHVGDSEIDDGQGATNAGIAYRLIDRTSLRPVWMNSLDQIEEGFQWID